MLKENKFYKTSEEKNDTCDQDKGTKDHDIYESLRATSLAELCFNNDINIDYFNGRFLLCKSMQGFASVCEARTRVLIPLFFRFLKYIDLKVVICHKCCRN
jgi:hypothetical protein